MITGVWLTVVWVLLGIAVLIALAAVLYYPCIILYYEIQEWIEKLRSRHH